jgi:hypothetical protein
MARIILLLAALVVSTCLMAQQPMSPNQPQAAPNQMQAVPPNVISVNPPPPASVVVVGGGLYGPSVFTAPVGGFATPQLPAGATQTGFVPGSAGASVNTPAYLGVTSTLGPAPLVYEGGQPGYAYAPAGGVIGTQAVPAEAAATTGRLINDIAPSSYAGTVAPLPNGEVVNLAPPPPPVSLGEVASSYRAVQPHPIRVYVNPAAEQLEPTYVVTGAAIASNVIPEKIIVPQSAPSQAPQAPQAGTQIPPQSQQMAANTMPPQAAPSAQTQQPAPPAQNQPQPGQTETNKPAQTETNKPAQAETSREPTQLPATSTVLPLLGLLGLVSTGLGLWVLRAKR